MHLAIGNHNPNAIKDIKGTGIIPPVTDLRISQVEDSIRAHAYTRRIREVENLQVYNPGDDDMP
jgi:hypothetical protein